MQMFSQPCWSILGNVYVSSSEPLLIVPISLCALAPVAEVFFSRTSHYSRNAGLIFYKITSDSISVYPQHRGILVAGCPIINAVSCIPIEFNAYWEVKRMNIGFCGNTSVRTTFPGQTWVVSSVKWGHIPDWIKITQTWHNNPLIVILFTFLEWIFLLGTNKYSCCRWMNSCHDWLMSCIFPGLPLFCHINLQWDSTSNTEPDYATNCDPPFLHETYPLKIQLWVSQSACLLVGSKILAGIFADSCSQLGFTPMLTQTLGKNPCQHESGLHSITHFSALVLFVSLVPNSPCTKLR